LANVPVAKVIHTFKAVAEDHIALHSDGWRNPKYVAQWTVDEIDVTAVLDVLRPI
jgi:hypothetical protein